MKSELDSFITPNAQSGLALATALAWELRDELRREDSEAKNSAGTNGLPPAPVPLEIVGCILFYAIAAVNHGWAGAGGVGSFFLSEKVAA